jgi:CheY-like chemotaxis protein
MTEKPRILIVDDSVSNVEVLNAFLEKDYEVVIAYNGHDALRVFESNKNNLKLAIIDMIMPLVSGACAISEIKKQYPDLPIIAMTGWGKHQSILATEVKADIVLNKPFGLAELKTAITELLCSKS